MQKVHWSYFKYYELGAANFFEILYGRLPSKKVNATAKFKTCFFVSLSIKSISRFHRTYIKCGNRMYTRLTRKTGMTWDCAILALKQKHLSQLHPRVMIIMNNDYITRGWSWLRCFCFKVNIAQSQVIPVFLVNRVYIRLPLNAKMLNKTVNLPIGQTDALKSNILVGARGK